MSAVTPLMTACRRCGRHVLEVRIDFDLGVPVGTPRIDPVTLTPEQVVACVITDVPLWQVYEHGGRTVTSQRGRLWPREPMPGDTVPEHACTRTWTGPPLVLAQPKTPTLTEPPF